MKLHLKINDRICLILIEFGLHKTHSSMYQSQKTMYRSKLEFMNLSSLIYKIRGDCIRGGLYSGLYGILKFGGSQEKDETSCKTNV